MTEVYSLLYNLKNKVVWYPSAADKAFYTRLYIRVNIRELESLWGKLFPSKDTLTHHFQVCQEMN